MNWNGDLSVPGVEYCGRGQVEEIYKELSRQAECYKDVVVPTESLSLLPVDDGVVLKVPALAGSEPSTLPMSRRALIQLYAWIGLPLNSRLHRRLTTGYEETQGDSRNQFWETLCNLTNDHFRILKTKRMIRTLMRPDGVWYVRAILSAKYRIIPNDQLFKAVAQRLQDIGAEIWDARLSEDIFYLYAVAPGITAQVRADRTFESDRWIGDEGDAVNAALMLSNSETGTGGANVCPAIVNRVTRGFTVEQSALALRHLGTEHAVDDMLSSDTIHEMNQLVYKQVQDYCESTFDADKFQAIVDKFNDATQDELEDPVKAAEATRIVFDLSEDRERNILRWLSESGDRSRYGLAKAVSEEASTNQQLRPDEAVKLEQISSALIHDYTAVKLAKTWKEKAESTANKDAKTATSGATKRKRTRRSRKIASAAKYAISMSEFDL